MHPPDFRITHKLSDWPDCRLELACPCSKRVVMLSVRLLLERGDRTFTNVVRALRCSRCGEKPAPVYLVAEQCRTGCMGPPPSWAVELVPMPEPATPSRTRESPRADPPSSG